jgi:hypothetical protein
VDLWVLDFDPAADENAQWSLVMPSDYNGGTVTAVFYWIANSSSTNGVAWFIQGNAYGDNEAVDLSWGTAVGVTDANNGTHKLNISPASAAVTLAGSPAASELVQFRVYRDVSDGADTLAVDARLVAVKLSFTRA